MSSKFFSNRHEKVNGSRGKQDKTNGVASSRTNQKRMNNGIKKTGRGR